MEYFGNDFDQSLKDGQFDVITEADNASEELIVSELVRLFPDHHIVGEEGGGMGAPVEEAAYRWYVDPLDGTTNFANGIPIFCVSLALTDASMKPLVGVIYHPSLDEMFSAVAGQGATLNGKPLRVSQKTELGECVLGSGFPYHKGTNPDNNLAHWGEFLVRSRGLRRMGAAALDLCYVAAGRLDGYWESYFNAWDCLAGALCILEAGGVVSDYAGNRDSSIFGKRRLVAANPVLHTRMLEIIASVNVPEIEPSLFQT